MNTYKLSFSYAKRHHVILLQESHVHYGPQVSATTLIELQRQITQPLQLHSLSQEAFNTLLEQTYEHQAEGELQAIGDMESDIDLSQLIQELPKTEDLLESEDDAPIIRLLNALLREAIKQSASDIHIETFENKVSIRLRIDGILREVLQPQRLLAPLLISRIKVMAKLDIAEKRLPQDGRITLKLAGRAIDLRVSTLPASHGERVVLRLLDKKAARLDLTHLGMKTAALTLLQKIIHRPNGIILVTGPTGSGKTTTLYAALSELNDQKRNILTVEDPIEYDLPGIGQTQVNYKVGMTFAKGLRAILRQDPDVVMVGEIRDLETAQIAVQASLTGHLVLSTLHTNSALGAITRLRDMGVEAFLLSSSLVGIVAQRLVRLLCPECKQAGPATSSECALLSLTSSTAPIIYHANGCSFCNDTGYRGRTGIYELIAIDDQLRTLIHEGVSEQNLEQSVRSKYPSIRHDGCNLVLEGHTSLDELLRVSYQE